MIKEACFACTTPYQIMGAISIVLNTKIDADLYVFGMFPNYEAVCGRIRQADIFSSVYAVNCKEIGTPGRVKGMKQMIFSKSTVSFYLPEDVSYRFFYSTSRALPKTILHHVLMLRNPELIRVIYEDGMGTYAKNSHPLNATKLMKTAEKILRWRLDDPDRTRMMAYIPELVDLPDYLSGIQVEQMPRLNFDSNTADLLETIFNVSESNRIHKKYIIFDTLRKNSSFMEEKDFEILDSCYEIIKGYAEDDVICKPHPRSVFTTRASIDVYDNVAAPMEVLYARMNDLDHKVLISYTSTAVFTPRIMFGREPTVISLHRLLPDTARSKVFEGIYNKFRGIYKEQDKVMAPRSFDELRQCMKRL